MAEVRRYNYPQYVQGIDAQENEFFSSDDNLFEKKIFKVEKRYSNQLDSLLLDMKSLFEYGKNKLRYLKSESGGYEYLSLVLMSVKEKSSLDWNYFQDKSPKRINGFILLYKIAVRLNNLHKAKIVHGCLKPENIYLDEKNNIYIANYGLREIMDKHKDLVNYSKTNPSYLSYLNLKGTVYEPPEMRKIKKFTHSSEIEVSNSEIEIKNFGSSENIDINSNFYTAKMDVYAYGILFYEIMIRDRLKLENMTIKNDSIFPGDRHFPDAIKALISQCLSINPSNRPSFPVILATMKKICDDNQFNLKEALEENDENDEKYDDVIIPFETPPDDIRNLFNKAFHGDIESCLIALQILDRLIRIKNTSSKSSSNGIMKTDDYGLKIEAGSIRVNIGIQEILKTACEIKTTPEAMSIGKVDEEIIDEKSGKIEIDEYKDINDLVFPKTILVPLISYEITSLTPAEKENKYLEKCFQMLKDIALKSNDPNIILYLACLDKSKKMSRSNSSLRSSYYMQPSSSMSILNLAAVGQSSANDIKANCDQLKDAAKFGSSEALVYLGILALLGDSPNKCNEAAYYFKVAADMYNPYGMINFGIMLQHLGNEESYALAGKYFKLASQSRLKVGDSYVGLELYNKEIEQGLVDDEASRKYDIPKNRWVDWFLTMPAGRLFLRASDEYISKSDKNSSNFQSSHQTVAKTKEEMIKNGKTEKDVIETDLRVAQDYGASIYTMYSDNSEFITDILDKYQNTTDFPRCPRVLCYGQTCFPVGPWFSSDDKNGVQELNEKMCVHFYCPRCNDYYLPSQVLYKNISSIFFPRNYLPKALKKLYQNEKFPENKPYVQYVPTIYGIPMMEVKEDKRKKPKKDEGTDSAGFFIYNESKKNNSDDEL